MKGRIYYRLWYWHVTRRYLSEKYRKSWDKGRMVVDPILRALKEWYSDEQVDVLFYRNAPKR